MLSVFYLSSSDFSNDLITPVLNVSWKRIADMVKRQNAEYVLVLLISRGLIMGIIKSTS